MEDVVSYELAVKLKEKGFREPCFGWYYPCEVCGYDYRTLIVSNQSEYRGDKYKDLLISHNDDKHIDAPTISQVLKYLREEKKIYIMVDRSFSVRGWHYYIIDDDDFENPIQQEVEHNRCYEQAAIAGIEYSLDNLI